VSFSGTEKGKQNITVKVTQRSNGTLWLYFAPNKSHYVIMCSSATTTTANHKQQDAEVTTTTTTTKK